MEAPAQLRLRTYIRRWLRTAFWHAIGPIDLWSGVVGGVLTAVGHFFPAWQPAVTNLIWQVPLWVAGVIVVARLALAPFWMAKEDSSKIRELKDLAAELANERATLESREPYFAPDQDGGGTWYFHLFNQGPALAENVVVNLTSFTPEPKSERWKQNHLPFLVLRINTTADAGGGRINPKDHEIYRVLRCAPSGSGGTFIVWQFGTPTNFNEQQFVMENDESWELSYKVKAANADELQFILLISIKDGRPSVEKKKA